MDPNYISSVEWYKINQFTMWLVFLPISMIVFAFPMVIAHAIIPSAVSSKHFPASASKLRPLFYAVSAIGAILVIIVVLNIFHGLDVVKDIYDDWWI